MYFNTSLEVKQVIVVRSDLKMKRGKLAAQVAHAAVMGAEEARRRYRNWYKRWMDGGQGKIVVKVKNLNDLIELRSKAEDEGLPVSTVTDRGLTQLPPYTTTCIAIGPAPSERVDKITGDLKLL